MFTYPAVVLLKRMPKQCYPFIIIQSISPLNLCSFKNMIYKAPYASFKTLRMTEYSV